MKKLHTILYNCSAIKTNDNDINTWTEVDYQISTIRRKACEQSIKDMTKKLQERYYHAKNIKIDNENYKITFYIDLKDGNKKYYNFSICYMSRP